MQKRKENEKNFFKLKKFTYKHRTFFNINTSIIGDHAMLFYIHYNSTCLSNILKHGWSILSTSLGILTYTGRYRILIGNTGKQRAGKRSESCAIAGYRL